MKQRRFKTLNDVRRYLANVLNQLENGEIQPDDGRVRGYICSLLHKILKDGDLEQRVKALEEKIGAQK